MFSETTRSITVTVLPSYLEEQSEPSQKHYVWAYRVRIENRSAETVQLRSRHWRITDAFGRLLEVKGAGVVGEMPVLKPGQSFEYQSGTPLETSTGVMVGSYRMQTDNGEEFDVKIPLFMLDSPHEPMQRH
jgi:ApaG protein